MIEKMSLFYFTPRKILCMLIIMEFNTNIILSYLKNNKLSKSQFCEVCNITCNELTRFMASDVKLNATVLFNIAKNINVSADKLLNLNYGRTRHSLVRSRGVEPPPLRTGS